eukprot:CAMPEP_0113965044 /NCGR_PEP_ID=MMETSP0011_2-20120614/7519_1 /TAXON_ID=101924 /ORGANISM="Rhodosorus marinus" /LENGTH=249 /DNA_ID=CAMNT_0000977499 /DNA_START=80 /DNA_END=828 /DNA_ORIENTATION=- /assembly_acc=CAM_ASM_000156
MEKEKLRRFEVEPGDVDDEDLEYQLESLLEEASESESFREQNGEESPKRLEVFRLWCFGLLFILFFAWGFVIPKDNSLIEWLHGIAHGAGRVVVLCLGIVLFSACKFSLQKLGVESLGFVHGAVGSIFAVVGLGFHAVPWIYLVAIKNYEMQGSLWSMGGFPNSTQMVITGSLLTLLLLFLLISTRERIRKGGTRRRTVQVASPDAIHVNCLAPTSPWECDLQNPDYWTHYDLRSGQSVQGPAISELAA